MKNAGLDPDDFAYPGGSDTPAATSGTGGIFRAYPGYYYAGMIRYTTPMAQTRHYIAGIGLDESVWKFD